MNVRRNIKSDVEQINELFGQFAKAEYSYDNHMYMTKHLIAQERIISQFYKYISGKCLDVATGTGTIARLLAKNTTAEIYGIDFNKDMIKVANINSHKDDVNIKFRVADAGNIPYKDNFFDALTCSYGFYWFYGKKK